MDFNILYIRKQFKIFNDFGENKNKVFTLPVIR